MFLDELLKYQSVGYSGICWGYNFGWQTKNGYWPAHIPLITITPYAYWAFKKHYELTKNQNSLETCCSIAQFALRDLKKEKTIESCHR